MLTLVDVDAALAELTQVLDLDARVICIKGGLVQTPTGPTSPADRRFDPFWAQVNEAGVTVGIHSGDAGYGRYLDNWEPRSGFQAFRHSPVRMVLSANRPPFETMAASVCQGFSDRFPRNRVASIEAGASWAPTLLKKLKKAYGQMPTGFDSDPVETFREHVWVAPFYEDNLAVLKEQIGLDHVLFGSDWPHAEGLAEPKTFARDLQRFGYGNDEIHAVMAENGWPLTRRI